MQVQWGRYGSSRHEAINTREEANTYTLHGVLCVSVRVSIMKNATAGRDPPVIAASIVLASSNVSESRRVKLEARSKYASFEALAVGQPRTGHGFPHSIHSVG